MKILTLKTALLCTSFLALAGCLTPEERAVVVDITEFSPAPEGSEALNAQLIIHRDRSFDGLLGGEYRPPVKLDGKIVGECAKRETLTIELAPGVHTVSTRSESANERVFEIEAGEIAYIVCSYTMSIVLPNVVLNFETTEEGVSITEGMRVQ